MTNFKKMNWKDIGVRVLKTFIQAFLGGLSAGVILNEMTAKNIKEGVLAMLSGGLSAGVCAVWNLLLEMFSAKAEEKLNDIENKEWQEEQE